MGQEIVYCSTCSTRVRGLDFEKGKAFKVRDQVVCAGCRPDLVREPPTRSLSASRAMAAIASPPSSPIRRIRATPPGGPSWIRLWLGIGAGFLIAGSMLFVRPSPERVEKALPTAHAGASPVTSPETPPPRPGAEASLPIRDPGEEARTLEERLRRKSEEQKAREPLESEAPVSKEAAGPARPREPDPVSLPVEAPHTPPKATSERLRPEWGTALEPARGRDFGAALALFRGLTPPPPEVARDLELLGQVANLYREALEILSRIPKGQELALEVREDRGGSRRVQGTFLRSEPGRVVLKTPAKIEDVELGEVLPVSLGPVLALAGKPPRPVASALACLLEGDLEAAFRIAGDGRDSVPERYWVYGRARSESRLRPDPLRALYAQALQDLGSFDTVSRGVLAIRALLREHASDPFVIRNKVSLTDRAQGGREFLLLAEDVRTQGALKAIKGGKVETFWTAEADPEPGKAKENYLEAVFSTLPDTAYKGWILAGGCCLETFEFSCQGSELLGPGGKGPREPATPGSGVFLPVKPWISGLKKSHSAHSGPKHAAHWEWIPLALPKYAKPGAQCLRIFFEEKGFSVGGLCITATRTGPPGDPELKDWIRLRGDRPKIELVQPPKAIPIVRCLFDGTDRRLVGTLEKGSLLGTPLYEKCFTGLERSEPILLPVTGELRATYFLRTATSIRFRLRLDRSGDQTVPYDFLLEKPAVGVPTDIRIPLAQFREPYQSGSPPIVPGDRTRMIYIFGDLVDCGLRLDALSLVELRGADRPASAVPTGPEPGSAAPWKVLFDGQSLRGFANGIENAWHVEEGRLVHDSPVDNAAQTQDEFGDAEIRIRFEMRGVSRFYMVVRQDGKGGGMRTSLSGDEIAGLQGEEHELLFSCRGNKVTAWLDGKARPVDVAGQPQTGRIQLNAFDGSFRLRALEYREIR